MTDIDYIKRDKNDSLETMNQELTFMKNSIDDYKKIIRKEMEGQEIIYRRDDHEWIKTHYERFELARAEVLERKAYLLGYEVHNIVTGK